MSFGKKIAVGLATASLVAAPVVASAAPMAADLARAASVASEGEDGDGGVSLPIILLGVAAVIGGIILIADDNEPTSP